MSAVEADRTGPTDVAPPRGPAWTARRGVGG
jgi:hypothetical protein